MVGELGVYRSLILVLQKCTEYWPEEQVVYDGVEITVRKVIHTEDYRLRLISLRVRPGAGLLGGKGFIEDATEEQGSGVHSS